MITLKDVELRRSRKILLEGAELIINKGEKVGLVGRNGVGKSTLFSLLSGNTKEEKGFIELPKKCHITQVDQYIPETDEGATDFVISGDLFLMDARVKLKKAIENNDGIAMAQAYCDLADAGEHDAKSRAQSLLIGLGFQPNEVNNPVNLFSGGWRMRLQLARTLMCPSDLMLLDEPTNHLDLDAISWLESWLINDNRTIITISHDREFLDNVTNVTVHFEKNKLFRYNGNYSAFETLRSQRIKAQENAYFKQKEKIAHIQKYIDRFRFKATKARQAQSKIKALERMERVSDFIADSDISLKFRKTKQIPSPMLTIRNAIFGYVNEGNISQILTNINRTILAGQRIGILGCNGQGKSTFVKTISEEIKPLFGSITQGKGLRVGYFAQQELDVIDINDTPLQHMVRLSMMLEEKEYQDVREQELRSFLGTFNISGDLLTQKIGSLSGGEKARLVLASIVWQKPNLLVLDEPTNHLDLPTREALALALNDFEGTVILVSHDRALLRAVCDEFWVIGYGQIRDFDGDLEDYKRYLLDESWRISFHGQKVNKN